MQEPLGLCLCLCLYHESYLPSCPHHLAPQDICGEVILFQMPSFAPLPHKNCVFKELCNFLLIALTVCYHFLFTTEYFIQESKPSSTGVSSCSPQCSPLPSTLVGINHCQRNKWISEKTSVDALRGYLLKEDLEIYLEILCFFLIFTWSPWLIWGSLLLGC